MKNRLKTNVINGKLFFTSVFVLLVLLTMNSVWAYDAMDFTAQVVENPPSITLKCAVDSTATSYTIYRKGISDTTWTSKSTITDPTIAATTTIDYVDTDVTIGTSYEYKIVKNWSGKIGSTTYSYSIASFLRCGINIPAIENRGKMILLVDDSVASSLTTELQRLRLDLIADGWTVIRRDVSRMGTPAATKAIIKEYYNADPANVKSVFLFGHIPVLRTGQSGPDGHGGRPLPADSFYADMDGVWTDTATLPPTGEFAGNSNYSNIPGDGVYDQTTIPSDVELEVGRVDLFGMPAFNPLTEIDLLRRYLEKDHNYRVGKMNYKRKGFIDQVDATVRDTSATNFSQLCAGPSSVERAMWSDKLLYSSYGYLWASKAYFANPASMSDTTTAIMAKSSYPFVFAEMWGSFIGDWTYSDDLLKGCISQKDYGLASVWAPYYWPFTHMAMGESIGYCTKISQNGYGLYSLYGSSQKQANVERSLLGDPTLRLYPVDAPKNLALTTNESGKPVLSWDSNPKVLSYYVYRGDSLGNYTNITPTPISTNSFVDIDAPIGSNTYIVRPLILQTSASGTYYDVGQGSLYPNLDTVIAPPPTTTPTFPKKSWAPVVNGISSDVTISDFKSILEDISPTQIADTAFCDVAAKGEYLFAYSSTTTGATTPRPNIVLLKYVDGKWTLPTQPDAYKNICTIGGSNQITVDGNNLYLIKYSYTTQSNYNILRIDITDPEHPVIKSDWSVGTNAHDLTIRDNTLFYQSANTSDIYVNDYNTKPAPTAKDYTIFREFVKGSTAVPFNFYVNRLVGEYMYAFNPIDNTANLNITVQRVPKSIGTEALLDAFKNFGYTYSSTMLYPNLSTNRTQTNIPSKTGLNESKTSIQDLLINGKYAYATMKDSLAGYANRGIRVLDISDPLHPVPGAFISMGSDNYKAQPYKMAKYGDVLYVTSVTTAGNGCYDNNGFLWAYNISDPSNPVLITRIDLQTITGSIPFGINGFYGYINGYGATPFIWRDKLLLARGTKLVQLPLLSVNDIFKSDFSKFSLESYTYTTSITSITRGDIYTNTFVNAPSNTITDGVVITSLYYDGKLKEVITKPFSLTGGSDGKSQFFSVKVNIPIAGGANNELNKYLIKSFVFNNFDNIKCTSKNSRLTFSDFDN